MELILPAFKQQIETEKNAELQNQELLRVRFVLATFIQSLPLLLCSLNLCRFSRNVGYVAQLTDGEL